MHTAGSCLAIGLLILGESLVTCISDLSAYPSLAMTVLGAMTGFGVALRMASGAKSCAFSRGYKVYRYLSPWSGFARVVCHLPGHRVSLAVGLVFRGRCSFCRCG